MRVKAFIRVAKTRRGGRVMASARANHAPIDDSYGQPYPTVSFAVVFVIPDEAFRGAERVIAEIEVPPEQVEINAEVADA
jgi:type II secretory pathway component GspD/PulD (secretin)